MARRAPDPEPTSILNRKVPCGCTGCIGLIVVGFVGLVAIVMMIGPAEQDGAPAPTPTASTPPAGPGPVAIGQLGTLGYPSGGGNAVWVATLAEDFDPMIDAQNAAAGGGPGAGAAIFRLADAGRVRAYPVGTRVRVIDSGVFSRQVEVLDAADPADVGRTGWVQTELVRPEG